MPLDRRGQRDQLVRAVRPPLQRQRRREAGDDRGARRAGARLAAAPRCACGTPARRAGRPRPRRTSARRGSRRRDGSVSAPCAADLTSSGPGRRSTSTTLRSGSATPEAVVAGAEVGRGRRRADGDALHVGVWSALSRARKRRRPAGAAGPRRRARSRARRRACPRTARARHERGAAARHAAAERHGLRAGNRGRDACRSRSGSRAGTRSRTRSPPRRRRTLAETARASGAATTTNVRCAALPAASWTMTVTWKVPAREYACRTLAPRSRRAVAVAPGDVDDRRPGVARAHGVRAEHADADLLGLREREHARQAVVGAGGHDHVALDPQRERAQRAHRELRRADRLGQPGAHVLRRPGRRGGGPLEHVRARALGGARAGRLGDDRRGGRGVREREALERRRRARQRRRGGACRCPPASTRRCAGPAGPDTSSQAEQHGAARRRRRDARRARGQRGRLRGAEHPAGRAAVAVRTRPSETLQTAYALPPASTARPTSEHATTARRRRAAPARPTRPRPSARRRRAAARRRRPGPGRGRAARRRRRAAATGAVAGRA